MTRKSHLAYRLDKAQANTGKKVDKAETAPATAAGTIKSSSMSAQLQSLQGSMATSEVFDAGKVDAIKTAIADGKFKVNAEKVADGLLATVKNLLQGRRH